MVFGYGYCWVLIGWGTRCRFFRRSYSSVRGALDVWCRIFGFDGVVSVFLCEIDSVVGLEVFVLSYLF